CKRGRHRHPGAQDEGLFRSRSERSCRPGGRSEAAGIDEGRGSAAAPDTRSRGGAEDRPTDDGRGDPDRSGLRAPLERGPNLRRRAHVPGATVNVSWNTERAELLLEAGRAEDAEHEARAVLAADPHDPFALVLLARSLIMQGRGAEAVAAARDAVSHDPDDEL